MATRSATSEIDLSVAYSLRHELDNGAVAEVSTVQTFLSDILGGGVGANQASRAWVLEDFLINDPAVGATFRFTGTATQDVGSGSGKDALGQDVEYEEIVCLIIKQTEGPGRLETFISGTFGYRWFDNAMFTIANGGAMRPGSVRMWFQSDTDALLANTLPGPTDIQFRLFANGGQARVSIYILARHDDNESSSSSASSSSSSSKSSSSRSSASSSSTST